MRWARGYRNSLIHLKLMLGKKYWKADSRDPLFTLVSGNLRPTSQLICYRMAPGFCCLQPCQKCIAIPQSIFPVIQHTIFCLIGLLKKKKWFKQASKHLSVRWMHFSSLWMVPCTQSIFHRERSYLFPGLLELLPFLQEDIWACVCPEVTSMSL